MHLYLIRHGESEINLPGFKAKDTYDTPLTARGHAQARALAQWLPGKLQPVNALYASSMLRARQTADYVAQTLDLPLVFDDRVREIGNNHMDHRPVEDLSNAGYADYWASERPFSNITPGVDAGETLMHFRARVALFLEDILNQHQNETVMVVCHGFVIDTFMDLAYNVGPYRNCEVWSSNTGITHLQNINHPGRERWRLHFQNRIEHLMGIGGLGLTAGGGKEDWQD